MMTGYMAAFGIVLALGAPLAAGQDAAQAAGLSPGNGRKPIQEVLKGIAPANTMCRKDDLPPSAPAAPARAARKADASCAATLAQLSALIGKADTILIDTRQAGEFAKSHINNAVNWSATEVVAKPYLSATALVLIGDGKDDQDQLAMCSELRAAGFRQARVLSGGLLTWRQDGRPVSGAAADYADLVSLTPAELFREAAAPDSVILGLPASQALRDILPGMVALPVSTGAAVRDVLAKAKKPLSGQRVVVVADERFGKPAILALSEALRPAQLLVYARPEAEYRSFLRNQQAMWAKQAKGPSKPRCGV